MTSWLYSPFVRYNISVPGPRACVVSFRDVDGMQHAVEVAADSLYEAAALGLKAFRSGSFAENAHPGPSTTLVVTVKAAEAQHELRVRQLEDWLQGGGKSPREQVLKAKLRKLLGVRE